MSDRIRRLYKIARELEQTLGRKPTPEEIAGEMGVELAQGAVDAAKSRWRPLSLETPVGEEEDTELGAFIEDEATPTPTQTAYQNLLREKIEEVLATLTPREARILRLRFGLHNGRCYTLEEVGPEVRPDPRAHPPDRGQGAAPPAPPAPGAPAARLPELSRRSRLNSENHPGGREAARCFPLPLSGA